MDSLPQLKRILGVVTEVTFQTHSNLDIDEVFPVVERVFATGYGSARRIPGRNGVGDQSRFANHFVNAYSQGTGTTVHFYCDLRMGAFFAMFAFGLSSVGLRAIVSEVVQVSRSSIDANQIFVLVVLANAILIWWITRQWASRTFAMDQRFWNQIEAQIERVHSE